MRLLSASNRAGIAGNVTRPVYLALIGASSRFSTRETISYGGYTWTAQSMQVSLDPPRLSFLNAVAVDWLSSIGGDEVEIWMLHGAGPWTDGDADLVYSGIIGAITVDDHYQINLRDGSPRRVPQGYVRPPDFNHAPADGTRLSTPNGIVELRKS